MKKITTLLLFVFFINARVDGQIIVTVAGNGTGGYVGDSVLAIKSILDFPFGVAADTLGNVYITDRGNERVRRIDTAGYIRTIAGNGIDGHTGDGAAAKAAELSIPSSVAKDKHGNIYICDYGSNYIRKVDTAGIITSYGGNGGAGYTGDNVPATLSSLYYPQGLATDAIGNLYISDNNNNRIRKIDTAGTITTIAGTGAAGYAADGSTAAAAAISNPVKVATDSKGNIYFSDQGNMRVRKISTTGIVTTIAGNGSIGYSGDGSAATAAKLNYPEGVAIDKLGNVYIADMYNNCIRKVDTSGIITTIAGTGSAGYTGNGDSAIHAELNWPVEVSIANGYLYVCDFHNHVIRAIGNPPIFAKGDTQSISICQNANAYKLDTVLSVKIVDTTNVIKYKVVNAPKNGTLAGFRKSLKPSNTLLVPTGLTYTPTPGYSGPDSFVVSINDGVVWVNTIVRVTVHPLPNPGLIRGSDSICIGYSFSFSDTVAAGKWSISNPVLASINSMGSVTGISTGNDTVYYTVNDGCSSQAHYAIVVVPTFHCETAVKKIPIENSLQLFPNPSTGKFTINIPESTGEFLITITDLYGRKIMEFTPTVSKSEIELNQPDGIYILSVKSMKGNWEQKIVLVH